MAPSLLETFRVLASFSPPRVSLKDAPWEAYVDWAIAQGLAPLASYNLDYRLGGAGAPEWARDRLLSIYQGSANDNVMKLVHFKRVVDDLEGRKLVLLGGASFAESLYPHVAFRPVLEVQVLVSPRDVDPFAKFLSGAQFLPLPKAEGFGAQKVLSDGRTPVLIFGELFGPKGRAAQDALFARALPLKVFGPSFHRLDLEDALLVLCLEHARRGYEVPWLSYLDARELVRGAPDVAGPYSRPCKADLLKDRAAELGLSRALYCTLSIVARLFPAETSDAVAGMLPPLRPATRRLLDRLVVEPASEPGRTRAIRGGDRLRRLLAGGR